MRRSRPRIADARRARRGGFTLIELIIVMLLLAIAAGMVAPRMSSFFRGRALNFEARRLLSLSQYAQSRAVGEGVPVILWVDTRNGRYGVHVQVGHEEPEDRVITYQAEPTISLQAASDAALVSEQDDQALGLPEGMAAIRFTPEGYFDEASVKSITLQQNEGPAIELVQQENRLGYELRPVTQLR